MNKIPLYKQIYHSIKDKIISGELRPKDRVPSEQEFMDEFMVSKITVKNALAVLVDEGLVTRIQGKGTFVSVNPNSITVDPKRRSSASSSQKKPVISLSCISHVNLPSKNPVRFRN
ncbi:MAG: GntR family transcriptional regulator [Paenibacillus sp.]|nr:GntR family transcriptional regulator [Paenibacillus sp.]